MAAIHRLTSLNTLSVPHPNPEPPLAPLLPPASPKLLCRLDVKSGMSNFAKKVHYSSLPPSSMRSVVADPTGNSSSPVLKVTYPKASTPRGSWSRRVHAVLFCAVLCCAVLCWL